MITIRKEQHPKWKENNKHPHMENKKAIPFISSENRKRKLDEWWWETEGMQTKEKHESKDEETQPDV